VDDAEWTDRVVEHAVRRKGDELHGIELGRFGAATRPRREKPVRDDFPKAVLETLAKRVGYRCSNQACRKLTSGPHTDEAKAVNVGVPGHITAASPGGPRFAPSLTPEERRSADNGIWLCQTCGKLVDSDEARFPVTLLREWRQKAEDAARLEVESSPPGAAHDGHSIRFAVDDWRVWRERGNLPGDTLVFISGWRRGDVLYSCTVRFRNDLEWEEQLHRFRAEFRKGDLCLFTDSYVLNDNLVMLPPRKWVSLEVSHGLRDRSVIEAADGVWLVAETVGDNVRFEWLLARLAVRVTELEEG
jgi:hypothetical protein